MKVEVEDAASVCDGEGGKSAVGGGVGGGGGEAGEREGKMGGMESKGMLESRK